MGEAQAHQGFAQARTKGQHAAVGVGLAVMRRTELDPHVAIARVEHSHHIAAVVVVEAAVVGAAVVGGAVVVGAVVVVGKGAAVLGGIVVGTVIEVVFGNQTCSRPISLAARS